MPAFNSWRSRRNQSRGKTLEDDSAVAVAGEGFGQFYEGCEEEEEEVRVWIGGGAFGFGKRGTKEKEGGQEEAGEGVVTTEEGDVDDKLEGGVNKKVYFTGSKGAADDEGTKDIDRVEGSGAQTLGAGTPTKSGKKKPVHGQKLKDVRKAETIRVLQECRPKSRDWWMCKGRAEEALQTYGDGGDACTLDDYNEIVIQFSFVVLFGVAFPITGLLALLSNLIEVSHPPAYCCLTLNPTP